MSERDEYPAGVPCWVEGLHRDVDGALDFYGPLMDWEFEGPGGEDSGYFVARLGGREVAGLAPMPDQVTKTDALWMTHVRVDSAAEAAEKATAAGGEVHAGPMDLPPAGALSVVADPTGAVFCAWQPTGRGGAQLVNEPGAWSMSVLNTDDPDAAAAFYAEVFGWEAEAFGPPDSGAALFRLPDYLGGEEGQPVPRDVVAVMMPLDAAPPGGPEIPHWSVGFWVSDTRATAAHAVELGGRIVVEPHEEMGFIEAAVADPQGGVITISQLLEAH